MLNKVNDLLDTKFKVKKPIRYKIKNLTLIRYFFKMGGLLDTIKNFEV